MAPTDNLNRVGSFKCDIGLLWEICITGQVNMDVARLVSGCPYNKDDNSILTVSLKLSFLRCTVHKYFCPFYVLIAGKYPMSVLYL